MFQQPEYSEKYGDGQFEYRMVTMPRKYWSKTIKELKGERDHFEEDEWRGQLGIS